MNNDLPSTVLYDTGIFAMSKKVGSGWISNFLPSGPGSLIQDQGSAGLDPKKNIYRIRNTAKICAGADSSFITQNHWCYLP
jgi:hypothetical protein